MEKVQCEAFGKCDFEEFQKRYRCSKCGLTIDKKVIQNKEKATG